MDFVSRSHEHTSCWNVSLLIFTTFAYSFTCQKDFICTSLEHAEKRLLSDQYQSQIGLDGE